MSLRLARAGPVQVRVDRAVGAKAVHRCLRSDATPRLKGRMRNVATLRRVHTQAAAAVGRKLTLRLRLTPGLYRFSVRAHLGGGRLSRPVHRFLRVLR
jgi:hypothetical protein